MENLIAQMLVKSPFLLQIKFSVKLLFDYV